MGYSDLSGRPWEVMKDWFDALSGGRLNMRMIAEPARAMQLPVGHLYELKDERFAEHGHPLNPGLTVWKDEVWVNVRVCSKANHTTKNFLARVVDDRLEGEFLVDKSGVGPTAYGFEDLRLFVLHDQLHAIAAVSLQGSTGNPRTGQVLLRLEGAEIKKAWMQLSKRHEKNWMPVVDDDRLRLIYSTDPLMSLTWNEATGLVDPPVDHIPQIDALLRGGSNLIPYEDGWLTVVHQIHATGKDRTSLDRAVYVHRFVQFTKDLGQAKVGGPFYIKHVGIEFVSGLAHYKNKLLLAFGVGDREAWIAEIDPVAVEGMMAVIEAPKVAATAMPPAPLAAPPPVDLSPKGPQPTWNPLLGGFPPRDGRW